MTNLALQLPLPLPLQLPSPLILGVDEAGRGPLAGPVTAACVVFAPQYHNEKITDSKKLSEKRREILYDEIIENSLAYSIVSVGPNRIDKLNILGATKLAMFYAVQRVYNQLCRIFSTSAHTTAELNSSIQILIDGNQPIEPLYKSDFGATLYQEAIVKGDAKIAQISAASILAKVTRDRLMLKIAKLYPEYNFEIHKGYPTKAHYEKIKEFGVCSVHRKSFRLGV